MKIALKITPQRSTQYTRMTAALALPELLASPLKAIIQEVVPDTLAGQSYLLVTLPDDSFATFPAAAILSRLGAVSEIYEYFDRIGERSGPFLRPIEPQFVPFLPLEMAEARRYRGKTNETFTQVLLNVAIFASQYANQISEQLRIFDPLCGGGTTLFLALAAGYDAFGIDHERQDIETTSVFVRQFFNSEHITYKEVDEKGRKAGHRYQYQIGRKGDARQLVLVHGETQNASFHLREVPGGPHMHAIVGDLPYGIQHFAEISALLQGALPEWERMLLPGGALALAWNATRTERSEMLRLIEEQTRLTVFNDPPYTQFAHMVDRVIKKRDIIVAVKSM